MTELLTEVSVPGIAVFVYVVMALLIYTTNGNEKVKRFIPLGAAVLGAICGVVVYFAVPDVKLSENLILSILIGGASGLTATGFNQILKQLRKTSEDEEK